MNPEAKKILTLYRDLENSETCKKTIESRIKLEKALLTRYQENTSELEAQIKLNEAKALMHTAIWCIYSTTKFTPKQ